MNAPLTAAETRALWAGAVAAIAARRARSPRQRGDKPSRNAVDLLETSFQQVDGAEGRRLRPVERAPCFAAWAAAAHALADRFEGRLARERAAAPAVGDIQRAACAYYDVTRAELTGARRWADLVTARWTAIYLAARTTGLSLLTLGRMFNRDHSTLLYALRRVEARRRRDRAFARELGEVAALASEIALARRLM